MRAGTSRAETPHKRRRDGLGHGIHYRLQTNQGPPSNAQHPLAPFRDRTACAGESLDDELLDGQIFYSLKEAQTLIERWRHPTTRSGHIVHWAIDPRRRKPSHPDGLIRPSLWMGYSRISPSQTLGQD